MPASAESTPAVAPAMGSAVSQADALGLLRQVFADHLMTDAADVDVDTPFEELGFDSILITGINNRLEAVLGEIAKTILEAPASALRLAKRAIDRGVERDPQGALETELAAIEEQFAAGDWLGRK